MLEWNRRFEENSFPVDVFWMDIPHTNGNRYFTFDQQKFRTEKTSELVRTIEQSKRKLVVITDPHIKQDNNYHVFRDGLALDKQVAEDGEYRSIFL